MTPTQTELFDDLDNRKTNQNAAKSLRTGAFTDNMRIPIHRWFRYSAGFSAQWSEKIIREACPKSKAVLDPFAGSGTTLLASEHVGVKSVGFESHPFVYRISRAKLSWDVDAYEFVETVECLVRTASSRLRTAPVAQASLLLKCYTSDALIKLEAIKDQYFESFDETTNMGRLVWLAITSILRECSGVGTASWQYILPNKKKRIVKDPFVALRHKSRIMAADIIFARSEKFAKNAEIILTDARLPNLGKEYLFDLIVTSPPYPNNYDYADATRLEMTFWGEVSTWGDLHKTIRCHLLRSCSQHTSIDRLKLDDLLSDAVLDPIREDIEQVCRQLAEVRETKGGKKTYHTMVAAYFADMGHTWIALRRLCEQGAAVCFVVGDSAPYGVYVPTDDWLGQLAVAAGFKSYKFEKVRDRNIKWKNRKHRVPLKEGNLWVQD